MSSSSQSATILGVTTFTLLLGGIFVSLRTYTRTLVNKRAFGWDDALIVITWLTILAYNICIFAAIHHGYGRQRPNLSVDQLAQITKLEIIGSVLAMFAFASGKASVAAQMLRNLPSKLIRWTVLLVIIANVLVWYSSGITLLARCNPVSKAWHETRPGHCLNPNTIRYQGILSGALGAASDLLLACIPWLLITKVQTTTVTKVALGIILVLGVFAGISSIIKTVHVSGVHNNDTDVLPTSIPINLWTCAELAAINVAACIPTLGPLYQKLSRTTPITITTTTSTVEIVSQRTPPDFCTPSSSKRLYRVQINAGGGSSSGSSSRTTITDRKDSTAKSLLTPYQTLSSSDTDLDVDVDLDRHILVEQSFNVQRASEIEAGGSLYEWRDSKAEVRVDEVKPRSDGFDDMI